MFDFGRSVPNTVSDLWLVPALLLLQPEAGRTALQFRARPHRMADAERRARDFGLAGAKLPSPTGDVFVSRWDADATLRIFGDALLAIAIWNDYRLSQDRDWLHSTGYGLLRSIADMICSATQPVANANVSFKLPKVTGMCNEWGPADDNAFTVACARMALRAAIEASYELEWVPKPSWVEVESGLTIPMVSSNPALVAMDGEHDTAQGLTFPEPLLVLSPFVADEFSLSVRDIIGANVTYWTSSDRLTISVPSRPMTSLAILLATAQAAQATPDLLLRLDTQLTDFQTQSCTRSWGNMLANGAMDDRRVNDLNTSAAFLVAVMTGIGGLRIVGGVTDARYYYTELGISVSPTAALPLTWGRLFLSGMGAYRLDFTVVNQLLLPSGGNQIGPFAPWTVSSLLPP